MQEDYQPSAEQHVDMWLIVVILIIYQGIMTELLLTTSLDSRVGSFTVSAVCFAVTRKLDCTIVKYHMVRKFQSELYAARVPRESYRDFRGQLYPSS